VLDSFAIDNYAPGNWDWVYGKARFEELFVNNADPASRRFGGLAANVYHYNAGQPVYNRVHSRAEEEAYASYYIANGTRLLPPTAVRTVNGIRIGIIGCTTARGPQVVGAWVTEGLAFTDCSREIPIFAKKLRVEQKVDLVVLISEIEIGRNIQNLQKESDSSTHVDVVLNSDMHEETLKPVTFTNTVGQRTLLSEAGQDGTLLGELKLNISAAKIASWNYTAHRINDSIAENSSIAGKVALVRAPFTTKFDEYHNDPVKREAFHKNVFSGTYLQDRVDAPVGDALVALHRAGYTDEALVTGDPKALSAVIEGTSHDWMADAIRWWAGSDLATIRGFRYGTHIPVGKKITREDLYHFVPIGSRIGKAGSIHAGNLRNQLDNSSLGVFSTDPNNPTSLNAPYNLEGWAGGWMFAYSGPTISFDPYWIRRGPNPANAVINGVTLPAYPGDSRSRSVKVTMPCNRLPVAERAACDASGLGKAVTTINNATDGKWMPSWAAAVTENTDTDLTNDIVVWTSQLGTEPAVSPKWQNKSSKPTAQHQLPVMTVAGYYYAQSPDTLNNCPNCNPVGYSNDDNSADAPYILPVNMDPATGRGMLDAAGKPVMLRNPDGSLVRDSENRPQSDGEPIEFVEILVKYLQAAENAYDTARGRGPANPAHPRITLLKPLPGRAVFGFPVMQPLCGTVASIFSIPTSLWNDPATVRLTPAIIPCPTQP
ncbi:MAG: 5'-nucleotidase C-terminal domain-containing protein, partial [Sulfuricaulis sp.]|nr:5'-nucleotidase C-terminal domain-containing protein [Sulfuricaulis sp.]